MKLIEDTELERQRRQIELDGAKTQHERNRLGQFATPEPLASEMAKLALELWPLGSPPVRFLDPGIGLGSFYSAVRRAFPPRMMESARGFEQDPEFAYAAQQLWGAIGLNVKNADFTAARPPSSGKRATLVVANPPYVRHHHLPAQEKVRLQQAVAGSLQLRVSGLAGLYVYFLLLCHRWTEDGGLALWLIPSEFLDVNYGQVIREYLRERVTLLRLHRFDPDDAQFADALVSSAVVVFRKTPPPTGHSAQFSYGGSLTKPDRQLGVRLADIPPSSKWSAYPPVNGKAPSRSSTRLGDFFAIKRGIATGANDVFILPRRHARELGLPEKFLRPILPSPRNLKTSVVESAPDGYPVLPEQSVLVNCLLNERELKREAPSLFAYLNAAEASGIRQRYLITKRTPWYRQEHREPAPFLCTYMGRGVGATRPFRFIWNKSAAIAANVFLLLYPVGAMQRALDADPGLYPVVFKLLLEIDANALRAGGRVYGGALHKLEPRELADFPADGFAAAIGLQQETPNQYQLFPTEEPSRVRDLAKTPSSA